ncbi:protein phosphatase CheZ [Marinobacterium sediminicola]|uniref:Protein phosphatase CheZ n=1 Tax=Marinobacterium sediminicola TaxID=518898 RepID=A0ABY1RYJ1_9GAMM|nr:protein phosphatase CheZ [Marinobacterium sediminicola]ULG68753.1 protein phosphatase CheZ [Marinobacterium sediminicola]SMR73282.1 chemotaxis protein CheZ [Marinobacterium sediminicola]
MAAQTASKVDFNGFDEFLRDRARTLVAELEAGNLSAAMGLINELQYARHQVFYNEVGHLTRGLHEAIKAFSSDMGDKMPVGGDESLAAMGDASDRLNYVIELTEKNAHETMDRVDRSLSLVDKLDQQSERFKELLLLVGQLEGDFEALNGTYDRTCELKNQSEKTITELRTTLTDILVSQGVQDITGQLIRRVITLVTQVEGQLVQLMDMAAKVEQLSSLDAPAVLSQDDIPEVSPAKPEAKKDKDPIKAEGPQLPTGSKDAVCNQDDVDDLLSSLGF